MIGKKSNFDFDSLFGSLSSLGPCNLFHYLTFVVGCVSSGRALLVDSQSVVVCTKKWMRESDEERNICEKKSEISFNDRIWLCVVGVCISSKWNLFFLVFLSFSPPHPPFISTVYIFFSLLQLSSAGRDMCWLESNSRIVEWITLLGCLWSCQTCKHNRTISMNSFAALIVICRTDTDTHIKSTK